MILAIPVRDFAEADKIAALLVIFGFGPIVLTEKDPPEDCPKPEPPCNCHFCREPKSKP